MLHYRQVCLACLGDKFKVLWLLQASFSCQGPFHSLSLFLHLQDFPEISLSTHSGTGREHRFLPGYMVR